MMVSQENSKKNLNKERDKQKEMAKKPRRRKSSTGKTKIRKLKKPKWWG